MTTRHRDIGTALGTLVDEVLVKCPECGGSALVRCVQPDRVPRASCTSCGFERRGWPEENGKPKKVTWMGGPFDPYFYYPVLLQRPFKGEVLWAYNRRHLMLLREYIGASLRETAGRQAHHSLIVRLPAWMKASKNRDALVKLLDEMMYSVA